MSWIPLSFSLGLSSFKAAYYIQLCPSAPEEDYLKAWKWTSTETWGVKQLHIVREQVSVVPKDENLETLPEAKQLENNGYGEILTPESDASSAQSPNCDFHITKISETVQGIVTELSLSLLILCLVMYCKS